MLAASAHHGVWVCAFRCMNTLQLIYPFFDVHLGLLWDRMNEAAVIHSCVFGGFVFISLGPAPGTAGPRGRNMFSFSSYLHIKTLKGSPGDSDVLLRRRTLVRRDSSECLLPS